MAKTDKPKIDIKALKERIVAYAEPLKILFEALTGRKDIKSRVDVLANPQNPKSMSILSPQKVEFCTIAFFMNGVKEWGGIFEGLEKFATEIMAFSPSNAGKGREQVISFVGALQEGKMFKGLNLTTAVSKSEEGENEK